MSLKFIRLLIVTVLFLLQACNEKPSNSESLEPTPTHHSESPELGEMIDEPELVVQESVLDQNDEFEEFKETFLSKFWELNPSAGVYAGYYKHDDQLLIPNGTLRAAQRRFYVNELQALRDFDANQLTSANSADLAIIEATLKRYIWYIDEFRDFEWNPSIYNPAGAFGVILNTEYKGIEERLSVINNRLSNVAEFYEAAKNNIKAPTIEHLDLAIQQSAGTLKLFNDLIPQKAQSVTLEEPLLSELAQNLQAASAAVQGYIAWLEKKRSELLGDDAETGPRDFRIGAELYEKKFAHDIGSDFSAQELYALAVRAKQELHQRMISITTELWPNYFPDIEMPADELVAVKTLIDKLSDKHVAREDFVEEIKRQIPIIQEFLDTNQLLDSDPTRPLVVRLTPEYQRGIAGASVNAPGPYDATANTYYNVSPLDAYTDEQAESYLREYNHWILQILNIHEAIPGHYTQLVHANKSPSKIKSIFANGAMIEGWAVYSERMMLEEGYANNEPEMWLMYSKWNLRVVMNTILDYSVQVLGMDRQQGLDLLINEAFQQQTEAEGKWRRATLSQVQLTSYFSGYSEIYAFREELKERMGEAFDLRNFHNQFLSYGNAPVPVIKKLMLIDLESKLQAQNSKSPVTDEEEGNAVVEEGSEVNTH